DIDRSTGDIHRLIDNTHSALGGGIEEEFAPLVLVAHTEVDAVEVVVRLEPVGRCEQRPGEDRAWQPNAGVVIDQKLVEIEVTKADETAKAVVATLKK